MLVEIYSDVVCPWCYIGERRFFGALEALGDAAAVNVVFRPYQLQPDAPVPGIPLKSYLERRFGFAAGPMMARVSEAGRGEGIEFDWDRAIAANTLAAHRLLELAGSEYGENAQRALAERLFAAHFTEGRDISDSAVLADVAGAVGMDRDRVAAYLASEAGLDAVRDRIEEARRLGITAVPTFIFEGRWAVQGAQQRETFQRVLEELTAELARETAAAPVKGRSGGDSGPESGGGSDGVAGRGGL